MPRYAKRHNRRSHADGLGGRVGNDHNRDSNRQAEVLKGLGPQKALHQPRLDRWQAGTEAIDAKMDEYRGKRHRFVRMGDWDKCERCGLPRNSWLNRLPLHTEYHAHRSKRVQKGRPKK